MPIQLSRRNVPRLAARLAALRGKLTDAEGRLGRLYQAIENGVADANDPTLKDRIAAAKTERDIAQAAFDRAVGEMRPEARITADRIASFVATMRENVLSGDTAFRRAYLRAVSDKVKIDDREIRIYGRRGRPRTPRDGRRAVPAGVPSVRDWRARRDSNPRPLDS